jgi:predicted transcriptional regulator
MAPRLNDELDQALGQHHGFLEAEGSTGKVYVISTQVYREMMGVGTDEELAESLQAIAEGLADIEAGRTRPFREVLNELGNDE